MKIILPYQSQVKYMEFSDTLFDTDSIVKKKSPDSKLFRDNELWDHKELCPDSLKDQKLCQIGNIPTCYHFMKARHCEVFSLLANTGAAEASNHSTE